MKIHLAGGEAEPKFWLKNQKFFDRIFWNPSL